MSLPRGPGTTLFTGGGWLRHQREDEHGLSAGAPPPHGRPEGRPEDDILVLSDPCRILSADAADDVPALLEEIGAEQAMGRYVTGYVAYEAGAAFGLTVKASDSLPLAWMAIYPAEAARRLSGSEREDLFAAVDTSRVARILAGTEPDLSVSKPEFVRAIGRIRELIAAGDTYQVNYTVRARFDLDVEPLEYFLAMVLRQSVPYAAFLDLGDAQILSLSPELFLRRKGRLIESMPMKGTRPRKDDPDGDAALAEELIRSEKDRAENLMILDMVRNDLGRVSRAGSVHVPALYSVEPYRTVWQMASTVTGRVRSDARPAEILAATFPGASITGAPKHHTMEIIAELETEPRGVYTGTVGLFLPGSDFTCNLAIRTLVHQRGAFRLGVGAGMVWDSNPLEEYEETLTKATFALPPSGSRWEPAPPDERVRVHSIGLFETLLLEAAGADTDAPSSQDQADAPARYRYLAEHLDRLENSAQQLRLGFDRDAARARLVDFARSTPESVVVRLDLQVNGRLHARARPLPKTQQEPVSLLVSPFRTDPLDPLLTHKTTARHLYDQEFERARACGCADALFFNHLGRVTEGAITNIFVRHGGIWVTPPLADGLLPGIWRAIFLNESAASERSLTLEDLLGADEIVIGNSVRGAMRVDTLLVNWLEGLA